MIKRLFLTVGLLLALASPVQAMPWDAPEKMAVVVPSLNTMYLTDNKDTTVSEGHVHIKVADGKGNYVGEMDIFGNFYVLHHFEYNGKPRLVPLRPVQDESASR